MSLLYTKGPWKAEPNYRGSGWFVDQPSANRRLASVNEREAGIERAECEANARLIAAAPDLLQAAKRALNVLKSQGESVRPGNVLGALEAAIAKAQPAE